MARLNYHHLQYFWAVAREGNMTRAAARFHVSQSALSNQIAQLEAQIGHALFERSGRMLTLTDAGRLALTYADTIYAAGDEMLTALRDGGHRQTQSIKIGAVATLSRNFQENFVRPLLSQKDIELTLHSGSLDQMLRMLLDHGLDLVLSNRPVHADAEHPWRCRRIARQPVSLVGRPLSGRRAFRFSEDLEHAALLLPGRGNDIRAGFDLLCEQSGLKYRLLAEVDDMAMLRLLARDSNGITLLPAVVVRDELKAGDLVEYCVVPGLHENFYAVTLQRRFETPLLKALLKRPGAEVLDGLLAV